MTTDNTPATLATAKHGGCVQLGDGLPPLPPMGYEERGTGMGPHDVYYAPVAYTAEQMRDYARAALSAQPSPGGQGDAVEHAKNLDLLRAGYHVDAKPREAALNAAIAALAARQPVGELVVSDLSGYAVAASQVRRGYDVECDRCGKFCDEGPGPCQPAQAVNLAQLPHGIRLIEIPRRNNLDPINVFVQDYELGRGRIVVTCYGQAWCGFWGAMGDRTVMQFVAACDADYVAGNMLSGRHEHVKKHERVYVERIAAEVIAEFRALIDSPAVQS